MKKLLVLFLFTVCLFSCNNNITSDQLKGDEWLKSISWQGESSQFPSNPAIGYAFYNTSDGYSYVFTNDGWIPIAKSEVGINWLGEFNDFPLRPKANDAFYNPVHGNSYIYSNGEWKLLAKSGKNGSSGILNWLGSFPSAPENPEEGMAYRNTTDNCSYIYSNGTWEIIAVDGNGINWLGEFQTSPNNPRINDAYFNITDQKAYIYDGSKWSTLATSSNNNYSVNIQWKGNFDRAPSNPSIGWVYYNTQEKKSFIYTGSAWEVIAQDGLTPTGFLIQWQGSLVNPPQNPKQGYAYYNSTDNTTYLYDGSKWVVMVKGSDGDSNNYNRGKLELYINDEKYDFLSTTTVFTVPYSINNDGIYTLNIKIKNIGEDPVYFPYETPILTNVITPEFYSSYSNVGVFKLDDDTNPLDVLNPNQTYSFNVKYQSNYYNSGTIRFYNSSLVSYLYLNIQTSLRLLVSNASSNNENSLRFRGGLYLNDINVGESFDAYVGHYSNYNLPDELDFGDILNKDGFIKRYSLSLSRNSGNSVIFSVNIEGEDKDCFAISNSPSNVKFINGGEVNFNIQFSSNEIGEKNAILRILTNVEDFEDVQISLKANAVESIDYSALGYYYDASAIGENHIIVSDNLGGIYILSSKANDTNVYFEHLDEQLNYRYIGKIDAKCSTDNGTDLIKDAISSDSNYGTYHYFVEGNTIKLYAYRNSSKIYLYSFNISTLKLTSVTGIEKPNYPQIDGIQNVKYVFNYNNYKLVVLNSYGTSGCDLLICDESYNQLATFYRPDFLSQYFVYIIIRISGDYLYILNRSTKLGRCDRIFLPDLIDDMLTTFYGE